MWDYLDGHCDQDEAVFHGICATRQLAKRQITWLRSWKDLTWLDSGDVDTSLQTVTNSVRYDG